MSGDRRLSIIQALDDPALFGPFFKGGSWRPWRTFLTALFGLPMDDEQAATFRALTGRNTLPVAAFVEAALIVGRRGGKSRVLALIAVFLATLRSYEEYLAPGEMATVAVIAANRSQARSIFRYVSGLLNAVPMLKALIEDETGEAIILTNRVVIEITTASFRTTRGYSFAAVLADEISFWRSDETSANPDVEILRALRPGMASIPGSILLLASSPYAKKGALYAAFRRHYAKDTARVLVWKADTATMNPRIDSAIIAEAYEDDPESARAEYGAEFRDDLADFITRETVDVITCWGRKELPPDPGVTHAAFCDVSGGSSDAMTLAIAHLADNMGILDAVLEIRAPFDPDIAVAECATLLRRYGLSRVVGDRYAGAWPVARFAEHGITFEQSARAKSDLYHDFLALANSKRVELLDHPRMAAQFVGLERRTARSGKDSIAEPPGAHDDICNSVAGVLVGLDLDRRAPLIRSDDMLANGQAVALPRVCDLLVAILASDQTGQCAVTYWAYSPHVGYRLTLADFDTAPLSSSLFAGIASRLKELATECRPRRGKVLFCTAEPLARQASARGIMAEVVPLPLIADPARLAMAAAGHVMDGRMKIGTAAHKRAESSPLRGQLDLRGGDAPDASPLRLALLAGIAVCLDDRSQAQVAA